tara:strand:- start:114 stop:812 length:699 start_codon:yes stop_codon:yes gene_type:complete
VSIRNNITSYVKYSNQKLLKEQKEFYLFNDIFVYVKDPLPENVNISTVLEKIEEKIPSHLLHEVESIFVGQFDDFIERGTNAFYKDGAIYITNDQSNEPDMTDDIVHEIAHAAEKTFSMYIYENGTVEEEFLGKRNRLYSILNAHDMENLPPQKMFFTSEYSWKLDKFFFQSVGYPLLSNLTMGLFVSPYGATSLSEYFSNGFEEYFIGDKRYLKDVSPVLYNVINEISDLY